jgi:hypothetical protein
MGSLCNGVSGMVLLAVATSVQAQADPADWKRYVLDEAPEAWSKFDERANRLQGSWTELWREPDSTDPSRQFRAPGQFKQRAGCGLTLTDVESTDRIAGHGAHKGVLRAMNPRYQFMLVRLDSEKPWTVEQVGDSIVENGKPLTARDFSFYALSLPHAIDGVIQGTTTQINRGLLPRNVFDPAFTVTSVVPFEYEGRRLFKVEFNYGKSPPGVVPSLPPGAPPGARLNEWALRSGWVLLDPDHYWVSVKCEEHVGYTNGGGTCVADLAYTITDDGYPILKRIVEKLLIPADSVNYEKVREFDMHEADLPESDFTLSAFGFGEPGGLPPKPTPWYLWLAVPGGILALAGVLSLGWINRKRVQRAS